MCDQNHARPANVRWDDEHVVVKKPGIDILKIHTGEEKTVMVLSSTLLVPWVHWRGDKSYPCAPTACKVCARGPEWEPRRQGWLAVQTRSPRKFWITWLTPGAVNMWRRLFAPGEVARGRILTISRKGSGIKGRMYINYDPNAEWCVPMFDEPNVEEVLRVMWDAPLRVETQERHDAAREERRQMRNQTDHPPAKPVDLRDAGLDAGIDVPAGGW